MQSLSDRSRDYRERKGRHSLDLLTVEIKSVHNNRSLWNLQHWLSLAGGTAFRKGVGGGHRLDLLCPKVGRVRVTGAGRSGGMTRCRPLER
jgi:hypothetical protein